MHGVSLGVISGCSRDTHSPLYPEEEEVEEMGSHEKVYH